MFVIRWLCQDKSSYNAIRHINPDNEFIRLISFPNATWFIFNSLTLRLLMWGSIRVSSISFFLQMLHCFVYNLGKLFLWWAHLHGHNVMNHETSVSETALIIWAFQLCGDLQVLLIRPLADRRVHVFPIIILNPCLFSQMDPSNTNAGWERVNILWMGEIKKWWHQLRWILPPAVACLFSSKYIFGCIWHLCPVCFYSLVFHFRCLFLGLKWDASTYRPIIAIGS